MKNMIYTMWLCLFAVSAVPALAQTPVAQLEQLNMAFEEVKKDTWKYLKAVTKGKSRKAEKSRMALLQKYQEAKREVASMPPSILKDAGINYADMSYTVLKEDFDKILDMEAIAEQSYDYMEAYILAKEKASEKITQAFEDLQTATEQYAKANNITLLEGEMDKKSEKIKKAAEALKYYNQIYLAFFKPYKQEAYAIDAMNAGDLNALEQNVNALGSLADEGMALLKEIGGYHSYHRLNQVTKEFMVFYKKEAEEMFPVIIDFFLKKEAFEKAQAHFEGLSKKARNQEEVDAYNAALEDYNTAVNAYNTTINQMNEERAALFDKNNKIMEEFFAEYAR